MQADIESRLPSFADVRRIFLADGDALAAPQQDLLDLISLLSSSFLRLQRIGMYATAISIPGETPDKLVRLREEGLGILHLGVETGDDELLV